MSDERELQVDDVDIAQLRAAARSLLRNPIIAKVTTHTGGPATNVTVRHVRLKQLPKALQRELRRHMGWATGLVRRKP
jgi:hypothetical protein